MKEVSFYRDTWVEVNLDAILHNVQHAKSYIGSLELVAVVKANGYGHGAVMVAKTALEGGASRLAVAFLDEALALRKAGITAPIHVLGATRAEDVNLAAREQIILTAFQAEWLERAKEVWCETQPLRIHLKFDSGMGRIGIRTKEELIACVDVLREAPYFEVEGAFSHFATADEVDLTYFDKQDRVFAQQLKWLEQLYGRPAFVHAANSAAGLRFSECGYNAVRMGIAMYGLTPSPAITTILPYPLEEAFSFHSKLIHVKEIHKGESVSYGATYTAEEAEWIGTIPVGYADGWIRKLQGFEVLVEGERTPIVGRVCMDQLMIRLPRKMPIGTIVTLIGTQQQKAIGVDDVAAYLGTINYEVTCTINFRVPRVFYRNGEVVKIENLLA